MFIPPGENSVETKTCPITGQDFVITDKDVELLDRMSPIVAGEKISLPTPTLSPDARMQRRLCFRNEMKLYSRKCDLTGQGIISVYSEDKPYTVYNQKTWWSDDWNPLDFGKEVDLSRPFFEQFDELLHKVPLLGSTVVDSENCEYNNDTGESKNCYLCFRTHYCEDTAYSYRANRSKNCIDCYQTKESEYLYECFQCESCQRGIYLFNCIRCHDSSFLWNCYDCKDCFMCHDLQKGQYQILNQQYSKEEYQEKLKQYQNWTHQKLEEAKKYFFSVIEKLPAEGPSMIECEGCVGDDLFRCRDCVNTFMMKDCTGCRHAWDNLSFTQCMDNYSAKGSELCYETTATKSGYQTHFCVRVKDCPNCMYCMFCFGCHDCFGCVGLKQKSYCIFNKQYSEEQYKELLPKLLAHMQQTKEWGEFFPHTVSPFAYNETVANEYFPLDKTRVTDYGWSWKEDEETEYMGQVYEPTEIVEFDERVVGKEKAKANVDACLAGVLKCQETKKAFKIIPQELVFYIENTLPIPRFSPEVRQKKRMSFRKARKLV